MTKSIAKAIGVRIEFEVEWHRGDHVTGYIGIVHFVSADDLDEPLKGQVLALAQQAAEQLKEPEE